MSVKRRFLSLPKFTKFSLTSLLFLMYVLSYSAISKAQSVANENCLSLNVRNEFELANQKLLKRISFAHISQHQGDDSLSFPDGLSPFANFNNGEILLFELKGVGNFKPQIVSFRGSVNERDWQTNSEFLVISALANGLHHKGNVHTGFLKRTKEVLPWLLAHLKRGNYSPVYFTGHSLGGALATMTAAELVLTSAAAFPILGVYSYGAPKFGDLEYASAVYSTLKNKIYRTIHPNDLIPSLPPSGEDLVELEKRGFKHLLAVTDTVSPIVYDLIVRPSLNSYTHYPKSFVYRETQSVGIAPSNCFAELPTSIADLISKYGLDLSKVVSEAPAQLQEQCFQAHGIRGYFSPSEHHLEMCE
jgi:Lipase (class 3)